MATQSPSERTRGRFDAFKLARERESLGGTVDAATLARLSDLVDDTPASIAWRIVGTADSQGRPALEVELEGTVQLECQRCLQMMDWPVRQRTTLVLARDDVDVARLDAESDDEVVLASTPLDPAVLVEDELVLALPYAPRHADGECTPPQGNE